MSYSDSSDTPRTKSGMEGVVIGIVTRIDDPERMGRVKLRFPRISDSLESDWARLVTFWAGDQMGAVFYPNPGDEVLVVFEHGDINRPYVIGSVRNGKDIPPYTNPDGSNTISMIRTKSGHTLRFDDTSGSEKVEILDKTGQNSIIFDAAKNRVIISSSADVEINAPGGELKIDVQKLSISASSGVEVTSSGSMDLKSASELNLNSGQINLN